MLSNFELREIAIELGIPMCWRVSGDPRHLRWRDAVETARKCAMELGRNHEATQLAIERASREAVELKGRKSSSIRCMPWEGRG